MACTSLLTAGFTLDCVDSTGGLQDFLITNSENITPGFTVAAGEVTALTQVGATSFYRYGLEEEDADFISTENKSVENGTLFYETILNFTINKLSKEKNVELQLMAAARKLAIIFQDGNGTWHAIGLDNGAKKMGGTNQSASGKAFGDANGYTIGLMAKESHYPYTVDPTVVAGLTIA
tara:strand:+ start:506 stop:1039 length:534 start_codon:yes stop_codon:yes gene_type:complete